MNMSKSIPMREIREFYDRNQPDGHWFDAASMRFFKTRLPENGVELSCGGIYFVTRETNPSGVSAYTVRRQLHDGSIKTVGEFHAYATRAAANAAIKQIEILGA
jgi:hypothetical protein